MNLVTHKAPLALTAVLIAALLAISPLLAAAATNTVLVSGNTSAGENQPGWLFNRDLTTAAPYTFNTDEAVIGIGSLYAGPITNTNFGGVPGNNPNKDKFIAEYFPDDLQVTELNQFSYDFLIGAGGDSSDEEQFYLNVYMNFGSSPDTKFYDCRYNIVPTTGSTAAWTTITFDPDQAYPVTQSGSSPHTCPAVPADMDDASAGSNIRAFAINMGDTSASDTGLDGYFDNVVLATGSDTTVYNFDPAPADKLACKDGGWMTYGFKNQGQCVRFIETGQDSR